MAKKLMSNLDILSEEILKDAKSEIFSSIENKNILKETSSLPNPKYAIVTNEKTLNAKLNETNVPNLQNKSEGMEEKLSNEIQVIKPTSVSPKISRDVFEECVRTVGK